MAEITYRPAEEVDLPQIRAINAHYILNTSVTFKRAVPPMESFYTKLASLNSCGLPYIVAAEASADGHTVLGYACLSPYRASYPPTTELSLFVHPGRQSRAVGSALLERILQLVREEKVVHLWKDENDESGESGVVPTVVRSVIAVMAVDPEGKDGGEALRRFYAKRGFEERGRLIKAGFKRGHWIDVIHLQFSTLANIQLHKSQGLTAAAVAATAADGDKHEDAAGHAWSDEAEAVVSEGANRMHDMPVSWPAAVILPSSRQRTSRLTLGASCAPPTSTRRVKCDEKKPVCGNCSIKSRPCDISGGTIVGGRQTKSSSPPTKTLPASKVLSVAQQATSPSSSPSASAPERRTIARRASHSFTHDLTPRGWDWVEACEYWNSVQPIDTEQDLLLPSSFITNHSKTKFNPGPTSTVFIMGSLAHNMSRTCRLLGIDVETSKLPELARMRQKYNRYMGEELSELNKHVAQPGTYGTIRIFSRLIGLIVGEIDMNSPNLRLHLQGFITLLMVSGGVQKVLERKEANILAIIYVIVSSTTMNSTSPSTDMINGEFSFTNQDIYTCYASTLHPSFPCPTQLFLCIRDVNRLRSQIASGEYSAGLIQAAIHAVFENIAAFRPDQWLERYEMPRASFRAALARIYQVAVAFYAKLTLASHASIECKADDQVAEARHLIHLIVSAKDSIPPKTMCWPLIVAGAGLAPARYSDKAAVEERLHEVGCRSDAGDGTLAALTCLRAFWVSGKTSWDDCFAKPIFPLAE